jgi:plastocyanin
MDPMKSRRWIAAAALAAAVVFLVMVTGERAPAPPAPEPAPVASSEAVLAADGGPPTDDTADGNGNGNGNAGTDADRDEVVDALEGLLDALGISASELDDCAGDDSDDSENGAGCTDRGGTDRGGADADPAGRATITITGFAFGQPVTVAPGATVEVVNTDAATHNVTAADGGFETPDLAQGASATFTAPSTPGRYEFTCSLHPEMTGTLVVATGAAGSSAGDRAGEPTRARPTEPATTGPQRGGSEPSGKHGTEHPTTTPDRDTTDGY